MGFFYRKERIDRYYSAVTVKNSIWFDRMRNCELEELNPIKMLAESKSETPLLDLNTENFKSNKIVRVPIGNLNGMLDTLDLRSSSSDWFHTLEEIVKMAENGNGEYKNTRFYKYLKTSRFQNLTEILGLGSSRTLNKASKHTVFFPWSTGKFEDAKIKNFKIHEARFDGILSDSLIEMHFLKFRRMAESVSKKGFLIQPETALEGFLLRNDAKLTVVVTRGLHRLEMGRFLGVGFLPIRRDKAYRWLVDLSQLDFWPAVKNGLISPATALQIFHFFSKQRKVNNFNKSETMPTPSKIARFS